MAELRKAAGCASTELEWFFQEREGLPRIVCFLQEQSVKDLFWGLPVNWELLRHGVFSNLEVLECVRKVVAG